jgi:L,D-peptidoglycan transpeptidase YkuD (ErfK/YbiS/YcfS/YnhG family)
MTAGASLRQILVVPDRGHAVCGTLVAGTLHAACALGRSGTRKAKREGDGATPAGSFGLVAVLYRPDRGPRPLTRLPVTAILENSGWCDDPVDRAYNREVRLPHPARHERLWRQDRLYDVIVVIDCNLAHPIPGKGSAIFLHLAQEDFASTQGCIAVAPETMARLLPRLAPETVIDIR